jgi:hypothetical protein
VFEAGRGGGGLFQIIIWKRVRFDQQSLKFSLIVVPESRHHSISPLKKNLCLKTLSDAAGSHPVHNKLTISDQYFRLHKSSLTRGVNPMSVAT